MESKETPVSHISAGLTTPEKANISLVCSLFSDSIFRSKVTWYFGIYFKTVLSVSLMLDFYKLDLFYN